MGRLELTSSKFTAVTVAASLLISIFIIASVIFPNPFSHLALKFSRSPNPDVASPSSTAAPDFSLQYPNSSSSCISKYQKASYRKSPSPDLSPYLLAKLHRYEQLHERCGPLSDSFNRSFQQSNGSESDCRYVVFTLHGNGLGNRILGLSSAFLYALLTDRVLLVDFGPDMADLFCEPFHNSTWLFPEKSKFPFVGQLNSRQFWELHSLGGLLRNGTNLTGFVPPPRFLLLFLSYDYEYHDKMFYMDTNQEFLRNVPWLILKSDQYFVPYLFLMPMFRPELERMFPDDKERVFHHLGNYLFNPSNRAWGLITRFYDSYLAGSDQRIGLQIRVLNTTTSPIPLVTKQILKCTQQERILPRLQDNESQVPPPQVRINNLKASKSVLIGSLYREFYDQLKYEFWARPTVNGQVIGVHQASHEESQQSGSNAHNLKAWADMYLLSLCDVLVTSPWSTFGYVAQGLGGLRPWILQKPDTENYGEKLPEPACQRAISMEPCFHYPPSYDRKAKVLVDTQEGRAPPMLHCEDVSWGLKLVNGKDLKGIRME